MQEIIMEPEETAGGVSLDLWVESIMLKVGRQEKSAVLSHNVQSQT